MFSFGANKQTARVAGEFYVNAINVMRGAESVSTYRPIPESEKFRIEYWPLEEAKLKRLPPPKPLSGRVAFVTGAGSGIGRAIAHRLAAEGACVVVADLDTAAASNVAAELGDRDVAVAVAVDVSQPDQVAAALADGALAFGEVDLVVNNAGLSISKPLLTTTEDDWDIQHDVMAKGSFLVSREAARLMIAQGIGGDIVYICSKNAFFAGPNNLAYGAAKADQAHQVRLLAAELGEHGIRVNGINPDGVVRGSGIFAKGWGAQRAAVYGVPEEELGAYYRGANAVEEGSPARARCGGRVRPHRRRSRPDDRPPHSRRCRSGVGLPALTGADVRRCRSRRLERAVVVNVRVDETAIELDVVHRFPDATRAGARGELIWDFAALLDDVRRGLASAARRDDVRSVAVDAWGVDYGLLDRSGQLLGPVHAYRSSRTDGVMDRVTGDVGRSRIYAVTGIQFLPFNTLYQLVAGRSSADYAAAERMLMVPDLVNHALCGSTTNDVTNASTTQLLDVRQRTWSDELLDTVGLRRDLLPDLHEPGAELGTVRGFDSTVDGVRVVAAASHDTASAVAGTPLGSDRTGIYISCGTWSLVGCELPAPVVTPEALAANVTNELGVDGTVRLLKNVHGVVAVGRVPPVVVVAR